ncbi:hypothetical protein LTR08_002845 [Meristemomyces frigidus]|nr:hypothetical protein LTR08_002845 [Meristemomyces frigidus]
MAPLPCSPVSNSTASEASSRSRTATDADDSDDSLTTPRPGPSDPAQRTQANLSRPSFFPAALSASPESGKSGKGRSGGNSGSSGRGSPTSVRKEGGGGGGGGGGGAGKDRSGRNSGSGGRVSTTSVRKEGGGAGGVGGVFTSAAGLSRTPSEGQTDDGVVRNPYTYGTSSSPLRIAPAPTHVRPAAQERKPSISFSPQASQPKLDRPGSHVYSMAGRRHSPAVSPHGELRNRLGLGGDGDGDGETDRESSADESTAIFPARDRLGAAGKERGAAGNGGVRAGEYGATDASPGGVVYQDPAAQVAVTTGTGYDGLPEAAKLKTKWRRKSRHASARGRTPPVGGREGDEGESEGEGWWKGLVDKYGSVELENKGSVARDHLALERTFLAWLRTSLAFASIGIAVTQLFRLNTSLAEKTQQQLQTRAIADILTSLSSEQTALSSPAQTDLFLKLLLQQSDQDPATYAATHRLRQVGKPLGATFLGISILILLLGFHRYFESQHYVIRGKFPASRGSIVLVSLVAGGLIVASLVVVIAIAPGVFEKK